MASGSSTTWPHAASASREPAPPFGADSSLVADVKPSPNYGERVGGRAVDMILLHYTGMPDADGALARLCTDGSEVSAHYVVMEDGRIVQCVRETLRAWHAGVSSWAGETDINSCSIGIEIVNRGHDWGYPDYPSRQIAAVTALCRGIMLRHKIPARRVLGHSDVAPTRKKDPGEKFPWQSLAASGVGLWVPPAPQTAGDLLEYRRRGRRRARGAAAARPLRLQRRSRRRLRFDDDRLRHGLPAPLPARISSTASPTPRRGPRWRRCSR